MSKSYKHTPYCGRKNKFSKKQANRMVRRHKMDLSLPKGGYKRFILLGKFVILGMDLLLLMKIIPLKLSIGIVGVINMNLIPTTTKQKMII